MVPGDGSVVPSSELAREIGREPVVVVHRHDDRSRRGSRGARRSERGSRAGEPRLRCATNNYAVAYAPELRELVFSHMRATEHFARHRRRIARISRVLSVQNRNMASQTAMAWRQPSITREQLVASYERHRTFYDSLELPRGLEWATPYVGMMAGLMRQIALK